MTDACLHPTGAFTAENCFLHPNRIAIVWAHIFAERKQSLRNVEKPIRAPAIQQSSGARRQDVCSIDGISFLARGEQSNGNCWAKFLKCFLHFASNPRSMKCITFPGAGASAFRDENYIVWKIHFVIEKYDMFRNAVAGARHRPPSGAEEKLFTWNICLMVAWQAHNSFPLE